DGPHRYFDTVYNDEYCEEHGLLAGPPADEPDQIASPAEAVHNSTTPTTPRAFCTPRVWNCCNSA
ncbi:hypothetical protein BV508_24810, partial [Mycobacterium intermedium]